MTNNIAGLLVFRTLSGASFGFLYVLALTLGASTKRPHYTFAGAASVALIVGTFANPCLGFGAAHGGPSGVFTALSVYCIVTAVPLLVLLTKAPAVCTTRKRHGSNKSGRISVAGLRVMMIMALMTIASNGTLLYSVRLARSVGLAESVLGGGLALVSLISSLGGLAASWIRARFGYFVPVAGGLSVLSVTLYRFTSVQSKTEFWIDVTLIVALFWFVSPYLFGLASIIDPDGRVASWTGGTKILFSAVGSALAGREAVHAGLHAVGRDAFLSVC